jgi:F-type H+-transporting ATPase subunit b
MVALLAETNPLIRVAPGLMIWTVVCFLITLYVLRKFAFGPIQRLIDERRDRIRQSLTEADRAREEARRLLDEHRALIGRARQEAEEIRQEVRRDAETLRGQAREEVEEDRRRRLEETKRQIQAETQRALGQIRAEVAELTLLATAKVTGKVLTDADQRRLIEEAIESLDFSRLEAKTTAK